MDKDGSKRMRQDSHRDMELDKSKICFIRPRQRYDYWYDAIKQMNYNALIPYKDYNLMMRILREAWFRMKLPKQDLWYNKQICKMQTEIFIVKDPLMTAGFLKWLRKTHTDARIILDYDNRVGWSVRPDDVPDEVAEKWSYDLDDCKAFGLHKKPEGYLDTYRIKEKKAPEYDIVYLGRDKGRASQLLGLKECFEGMGLKTYFHICPTRSYMRLKHRFYKSFIPYTEYLELVSKSRAILNIMPEGQTSITLRDLEAVFNGVKCITNNKGIQNFELYHPSRFFVLGVDDITKLKEFLKQPFLGITEEQLEKYRYDSVIAAMVDSKLS